LDKKSIPLPHPHQFFPFYTNSLKNMSPAGKSRPMFAPSARNEKHTHRCMHNDHATENYSKEYLAYRSKFMDENQLREFEQFHSSAKREMNHSSTEADSDCESDNESVFSTQSRRRRNMDHIPDSELAFFAAQNAMQRVEGREVNTPYIPNDAFHYGSGANIHKYPELWNNEKSTRNHDLTLRDDRFGAPLPAMKESRRVRGGKDAPSKIRN